MAKWSMKGKLQKGNGNTDKKPDKKGGNTGTGGASQQQAKGTSSDTSGGIGDAELKGAIAMLLVQHDETLRELNSFSFDKLRFNAETNLGGD